MEQWIITIKMPRNPNHDPRNKRTGECPYSSRCTDVTGEHHSFVTDDLDTTLSRLAADKVHVTRIEEVRLLMIEVKIEPEAHSRRDGYSLSIRSEFASAAWAKSDLTRDEMRHLRNCLNDFLEEKCEHETAGTRRPSTAGSPRSRKAIRKDTT